MSYFDDQFDAWMENDCKGNIEDYDPFDADSWPEESVAPVAKLTKSQKRNRQRKRAKAAKTVVQHTT